MKGTSTLSLTPLLATCVFSALLFLASVVAVIAQPDGPLSFSSCAKRTTLTVISLYGDKGTFNGQTALTIYVQYNSTEIISGGTYNVTVAGNLPNGSSWGDAFNNSLAAIVGLPIVADENELITQLLSVSSGSNNITFRAFDEYDEEILCFTFGYVSPMNHTKHQQAVKRIKKNNKMKLRTPYQPHARNSVSISASTPSSHDLPPLGTTYSISYFQNCSNDSMVSLFNITSMSAVVTGSSNTTLPYNVTLDYTALVQVNTPSPNSNAGYQYYSGNGHGGMDFGGGATMELFPGGTIALPIHKGQSGQLLYSGASYVNGTFDAQWDTIRNTQLFCVGMLIDPEPESRRHFVVKKQKHRRAAPPYHF